MKAKVMTAILATIMLTMTACGTISPPIQNAVTKTTATTTAESIHDSAASSEAESSLEDEKIKTDTFIAEFFDSNICFADTSALVTEAMKGSSFENEIDNSNGVNKITLKGSNGGGMIDVLCIDLSQSDLDHDMEYILENFGDYYSGQTSAQMSGITEDDFVSSYRMTSSVVSRVSISSTALFRNPMVWRRSSDTRKPTLCFRRTSLPLCRVHFSVQI